MNTNPAERMKVFYCTDLDKSVLVNNFEKKGWQQVSPDDDWHFYWAGTQTCRYIFRARLIRLLKVHYLLIYLLRMYFSDSGYRMNDNQ